MRLNRAMAELLARHRLMPGTPPPLTSELRQVLGPGIRSHEGCWLLTSQLTASTLGKRTEFPDATGYEAFVNHVHLLDSLGASAEDRPETVLGQALALGRALEELLTPHGAFEIVVATGLETPADCNVRFYARRQGEVWLEADLEGYAHEGILVIQTGPLALASTHVH